MGLGERGGLDRANKKRTRQLAGTRGCGKEGCDALGLDRLGLVMGRLTTGGKEKEGSCLGRGGGGPACRRAEEVSE